MLHGGGNVGPPPRLAYTIEDADAAGRIAWRPEPVDSTADEALAAEQAADQSPVDATVRREAEVRLKDVLADGPLPAKKILAAARANGISERAPRRARERMRITVHRRGFGADQVAYGELRR